LLFVFWRVIKRQGGEMFVVLDCELRCVEGLVRIQRVEWRLAACVDACECDKQYHQYG